MPNNSLSRKIIGVSGYIASGKSTFLKYLNSLGASVICADEVVSDLYAINRAGYLKVLGYFGPEYLMKDKSLNRKKIAKIIFDDPKKLKILHMLIHPLVTAEIESRLNKIRSGLVFVESTYFEEKFLGKLMDYIIWIDSARPNIMERALKRDKKFDGGLVSKIVATQSKPGDVDFVIVNNGSLEDLKNEALTIYKKLKLK